MSQAPFKILDEDISSKKKKPKQIKTKLQNETESPEKLSTK